MRNELLDVIRIANREFQAFIDEFAQTGTRVVETRGAARRLEKVDIRLKQVSQCLSAGAGSAASERDAAYEVMKYRENLKALRNIIETLQFSLLAEKARLDNVRANMQAARAWAASVRDIS
jgi:hypothetical protein